jgi:hypothetical protein
MQQQKERATHNHNFRLDHDTYYAIKQISSLRGFKHPAPLVSQILMDYVEQHKSELIEKEIVIVR